MIDLRSWAETLGLRKKKTLVDRIQDVAEDVVDSVMPVLTRPAKLISNVDLPDVRMPDVRMPEMRMPDVRMPDVSSRISSVRPALASTGKHARVTGKHAMDSGRHAMAAGLATGIATGKHAMDRLDDVWERTEHAVGRGGSAAGDAASSAAGSVGSFFGAVFSGLWWLTTTLFKLALLAGVAYAGWQWLQSRRDNQSWASGAGNSGSTYSSGTYGSVSGAPAGTSSSPAPAAAGSH